MASLGLGKLKERLMVLISACAVFAGLMLMNDDFHRRVVELTGPRGSTEMAGLTGRVEGVVLNFADAAHYYAGENMFMVVFACAAFVMLIVMLKT
jgi:hypothetical protein